MSSIKKAIKFFANTHGVNTYQKRFDDLWNEGSMKPILSVVVMHRWFHYIRG